MKNDKVYGKVAEAWKRGFEQVLAGDFLRALRDGTFTLDHYKGFLRETYHNVTLNPRIGGLFIGRFASRHPALEARLLKHIASEVGHDALALADLAALGEDAEAVKRGRPLPATEALAAFIVFQIEHRNPLAYFGYVFHLEAMAEAIGEASMGSLGRLGIPAGALSFLKEHAENDPAHMKLNRDYLEGFIRDEEDLEAVLYGVRGACDLYGSMFQAIADSLRTAAAPSAATASQDWKPGQDVPTFRTAHG